MPRTGGTLGRTPMRRLPRHAGQLRAPIWQGLRLATLPGPENQGSQKWGLRVRVPPLSPAVRSHGTFSFFLSLYTRAGQSRSGHTAASSIGRAPGSDPGEVGSIPAAAASRAMRRGFFSLLSQTGWGPGSSHPGLPCPVRAKPAARLWYISSWYISSPSFFRIWPGGVVRPSAWAHSQQCEQMVARPPGTRVLRKGLEVRVLPAAP